MDKFQNINKILPALLIFLIMLSCSSSKSSQTNYKTYSNRNFTLNYPTNWVKHDNHGFLAFSPKIYLRDDYNYFKNMLTIYKLDDEKYKNLTIDSLLKSEKEWAIKLTKTTHYVVEIDSSQNGDLVILKMDKINPEGRQGWSKKELKHFYKHKDVIYELSYSVISEEHGNYIDDAMMIFNSFKFKD